MANRLPSRLGKHLLQSVCFAAISTVMVTPAFAQDTQDPDSDEPVITVTGMRQNLDTAQNRKRNADTVVDSITAEDIGSFPDKSVAEALQRVPGVTVVRFAGTDDTSHFSAEPSGVIVRGLPQVRSEFNGRDTFSANSSRGLSWQDISPELLSGVDTYKNMTADMVEGGIAGTINLRTRLPFDTAGNVISISATANYGDIANEATPELSGVITRRFETGGGEFGIMLNGAYSRVKTASQGIQFDRMAIFGPGVFAPGKTYIPSGIFMRDNLYDRERIGVAGAVQWRSLDGTAEITAQYNRSQYDNSWREHAIYSSAFSIYGLPTDYVGTDSSVVQPLQNTPAFTFDGDGNFTSGSWSAPRPYVGEGDDNKGLGVNTAGQAYYNRCYAWEGCTNPQRAPQLDTSANALHNRQYTQDFGFNAKWSPSDRVHLSFDAQYVDSQVHNYNASVTSRSYANTFVDLRGRYPTLTINPALADNINLSPGGLTNANNYSYYSITDHTEDSEGQELAVRFDVQYDFDETWLSSLKLGARYADRDQTVQWGAYNWANISNTWTYTQAPYFNLDRPVYGANSNEKFSFQPDFFAGNQMSSRDFVFFNMDKLEDPAQLAGALGRPKIGVGDYYPVCSNAGYRAGESVQGQFGCYLPSEVLKLSEQTVAGYAMLKFGGPNASIGPARVSGNIGGRLVFTVNDTAGALTYPTAFTPTQLLCTRGTDPGSGLPTATAGCVTSTAEIAFSNGAFVPGTARHDHVHFLPSFNLKLDWTDRLVTRFAYSRA
ncbi:MAG: TonB-dependent receptor, partial [Sphingomonas sp.]